MDLHDLHVGVPALDCVEHPFENTRAFLIPLKNSISTLKPSSPLSILVDLQIFGQVSVKAHSCVESWL